MSKEVKVGILFFTALIILGVFTAVIGKFPMLHDTRTVRVHFPSVSGLKVGDQVRMQGLEIGQVESLKLEGEKVLVVISVNRDVPLRRGAKARIMDATALGGKYMQLVNGPPGAEPLPEYETIEGEKPAAIMESLSGLSETLSKFSGMLDGEGTLGKLMSDGELFDNLKASSESLKNILAKVEKGDGTVGKLVNDEELYDKAGEAMDKVGEVAEAVEEFTGKMNEIRTYIGASTSTYPSFDYTLSKVYLRIETRPDRYYLVGLDMFNVDEESVHLVDDDPEIFTGTVQLARKFYNNRLTLRGGVLEGKIGGGMDIQLLNGVTPAWFTIQGRESYDKHDDLDELTEDLMLESRVGVKLWNHWKLIVGVYDWLDEPQGMAAIAFEFEDEDVKYLTGVLGAAP
jgi:phospholipid/cholesterol/gamma-HCH transport system substrate-binding protein